MSPVKCCVAEIHNGSAECTGYNGSVEEWEGNSWQEMKCSAGVGTPPPTNAHNANLSRVVERCLSEAVASQYPSFTAPPQKVSV